MKKNTGTEKKKKLSKSEEEKLMLLAKADEVKGEQLVILPEGLSTENELKKFALGDIDDPEKKFDFYYKGIMKLMRKFLPKGKENEKARKLIYEEKNTFLTRGKRINEAGIRGADSRMAYISDIEEMLNIIAEWVASQGTMVELFNKLHELNIEKGYGKSQALKK